MTEAPPTRPCIGCGQTDDHPRHQITLNDAVGSSVFWHMDCHAQAGCDVCTTQIADAKGAKGSKLRAHLVALPAREN